MSGITLKRPLSFAGREWATVPWRTLQRDAQDELRDTMFAIPGLLREQEQVLAGLNAIRDADVLRLLHQGQHVFDRCVSTASGLRAWEQQMLHLCKVHQASREEAGIDERTTLAKYV